MLEYGRAVVDTAPLRRAVRFRHTALTYQSRSDDEHGVFCEFFDCASSGSVDSSLRTLLSAGTWLQWVNPGPGDPI